MDTGRKNKQKTTIIMGLFEKECQCAGSPINPGMSGCLPMASRLKFLVFVDYTDSTGAINSIPAGTVLNQTYVTAKLNQTDLTKRWYIPFEIFGVEAPAPEMETEDRDGIPVPTGEQNRQPFTYHHSKEEGNPAVIAFYDSMACRDLGVFGITRTGQLVGMNDGSGNLNPIKLQGGTLNAQYGEPVKGSLQKVMVSFLIDELENDANRDYIDSTAIAYEAKRWVNLQPIQIHMFLQSQSGQDTFVFKIQKNYGSVGFKSHYTGLVANDLSPDLGVTDAAVYNTTTAANVTVTLTEDTVNQTYEMTLASPANPDDVLAINVFKTGVNMNETLVTVEAS